MADTFLNMATDSPIPVLCGTHSKVRLFSKWDKLYCFVCSPVGLRAKYTAPPNAWGIKWNALCKVTQSDAWDQMSE